MKKFILLLTTLTIFGTNVPAKTLDHNDIETNITDISPRYISLIETKTSLTKSNNKGVCYAYTKTQSGYSPKVKVELQEKGKSWTTIKTWVKSGSISASVNQTFTLTKGSSYRLKATHYALDSNGSIVEYETQYSSTISY